MVLGIDGAAEVQLLGVVCPTLPLFKRRRPASFLLSSALMVEAVAMLGALRWAASRSFRRIGMLTDCLVLVYGLRCLHSS